MSKKKVQWWKQRLEVREDYTTFLFSLLEKKEIIHHLLISASEIFFFFRLNHDYKMWRNEGAIMMLAKYTDALSIAITRAYSCDFLTRPWISET